MEINKLELSFSQYVDALTHLFNTGQGAVLTSHPYSHYTFVEGLFRAGYLDKKGIRTTITFITLKLRRVQVIFEL